MCVTVGCGVVGVNPNRQPESRGLGTRKRRKVAPHPPFGGVSNSWGNSLLVEEASTGCRWPAGGSFGLAGTTEVVSRFYTAARPFSVFLLLGRAPLSPRAMSTQLLFRTDRLRRSPPSLLLPPPSPSFLPSFQSLSCPVTALEERIQ